MLSLAPRKQWFPNLLMVWDLRNRQMQLNDLCGSARWSSIRKHTLALEGYMTDRGQQLKTSALPFTFAIMMEYLAYLEDHSSGKGSRVNSFMAMVGFVVTVTGQEPVHSLPVITLKLRAVLERLAADHVVETRQARPVHYVMMKVLEVGSDMAGCFADMFIMSFFRLLLAVFGRFNDSRHARSRLEFTRETIEVTAHQSKTTGPTKRVKSITLVCPLVSLSGVNWWKTFIKGHAELDGLGEQATRRDYMLPLPSEDKASLVLEPAPGYMALRWLRAAVSALRSDLPGVIAAMPESSLDARALDGHQSVSLASFRVTAPDMAYQKGIAKERRKCLGHWTSDEAVDTHARTEHMQWRFGRNCFRIAIPATYPRVTGIAWTTRHPSQCLLRAAGRASSQDRKRRTSSKNSKNVPNTQVTKTDLYSPSLFTATLTPSFQSPGLGNFCACWFSTPAP